MFELFIKRRSSSREPSIAILKNGNIYINNACLDKYIGDNRFVNLFFDKEKRIIGIKPTSKKDIYSYPVTISMKNEKSASGCVISAVSFCKNYSIEFKNETKKYPVTWNDIDKLIVASLQEI